MVASEGDFRLRKARGGANSILILTEVEDCMTACCVAQEKPRDLASST